MESPRENDIPGAAPAGAPASEAVPNSSQNLISALPAAPGPQGNWNGQPDSALIPANRFHFYQDLQSFYAARGTTFRHEWPQSLRTLELYQLLKAVVAVGGYATISREEHGARHWRSICKELKLSQYLSYQLKGIYKDCLLAYEIARLQNGTPPPRQLLEDVPPVGLPLQSENELLIANQTRFDTLFNHFQQRRPGETAIAVQFHNNQPARSWQVYDPPAPSSPAPSLPSNAHNNPTPQLTSSSPPPPVPFVTPTVPFVVQATPANTAPADVAMSTPSNRDSRREGLRPQPPKAPQFTPNTAPVRQTRASGHASSPQPGNSHPANMNSSSNPMSANFNVHDFQGKDEKFVPMLTRDVPTPGSRPGLFADQKSKETKEADFYDPLFPLKFLDVPKSDHIYKRAHYGLQSGIPDEVDFALYHLVQISNQRWDKFKFEGFPLLAETLMEKAMEITLLCTGVKWELEYDFHKPMDRVNVLNSLQSTRDLLERIKRFPVTLPNDTLETEEFNHHLRNIKEATLVLRNMVLLKENALYVSRYAKGLLRDFLVILINIPSDPRLNEIKNDALDIAEEVTMYMTTDPHDPLWISLLKCVESNDRAHIIRALWSLTHFSTELQAPDSNTAIRGGLPAETLQQLYYLVLPCNDADVISGALDLLYQYTLVPENMDSMLKVFSLPRIFIPAMIDLLLYGHRRIKSEIVLQEEKVEAPPTEIPVVPQELFKDLMELSEPERSSRWLRCCFVEDAECEITQIALWQAYQSRFADSRLPGGGVLPAAEFIKNVSTTFTNAQAQVINGPGTATKFIIKGIRPLETAYTFQGFPYLYCKWGDNTQASNVCNRAFANPTDLRSHVFTEHMHLQRTEEPGHYNLSKAEKPIHTCGWNACAKFRATGPSDDTAMVAEHVASHLPEERDPDAEPPKPERKVLQPRVVRCFHFLDTPANERGEPYGVAYKAALIMRNIAWNLPRGSAGPEHGDLPWKKAVFLSHRKTIIDRWDRNRSLRNELSELIMEFEKEDD
ncbi:Chromatin structure-remodeling complex protein rsc9 [Paecilomyces lecythidis]|uniref:Chromatin structure-remodeling complex protein rsc9 n=1 Tax=Paecilomyces lecythidis TaxID=3004212 RepID=A0ABR3Y2N8_9EURO